MSNLLERLRRSTVNSERVIFPAECDPVDVERREAADEIARLQAGVNAVREKCLEIIATADSKLPSEDECLDDELTGERDAAQEILLALDGEVKP